MIQPLRTAHRRAFVALSFVLPAILVAGLAARHPRSSTGGTAASDEALDYAATKSATLWQKHAIQAELHRNAGHSQEIDVVVKVSHQVNEPDLLLYWAASEPQGNTLPRQALLLGAFRVGQTFTLQENAAQSGYLVLYSNAHQVVVDAVPVEKLP
jgi:hypothetical protein